MSLLRDPSKTLEVAFFAVFITLLRRVVLSRMSRYHEESPAFKNEDVELTATTKTNTFNSKLAATANAMRRQSHVWRSIILSTQNETYKPYCVYIRVLDFRNLSNMLEDFKFTDEIQSDFFAGAMERFHKPEPKRLTKMRIFKYLNAPPIMDAIGSAITTKSVHLEELDGPLNHDLLPCWISNKPHLKSLILFRGDALSEKAGVALRNGSQNFKNLTILEWRHPDADKVFSAFLKSLNLHTLEYLEMIGGNSLGELSFDALATQAMSLRELKLNDLPEDAVKNLHKLRACSSMHTLSIEDGTRGRVHLEQNHNDVFLEVVAWLSACGRLRDLSIKNLFDGPAILARALSSQTLQLERLSLEGYEMSLDSATAFHAALSDQRHLKTLELKGSCEEANPNHSAILTDALCNLPQLKTLRLKDISEDFEEMHITQLAFGLPMLEDFWTSGQILGRDVLDALANMKHLKTLNLYALTQFTCEDILGFIARLDKEVQHGFSLNIMAQDNEYNLTEEEQTLIREVLAAEVEGRLDFVVWRDDEWNSDDD